MGVVKMKLLGAALGCAVVNAQMPCGGNNPDPDVYPQPCPDEGKVTYQWCKNNYPDWIAVADGTTSQDEIQNPHIAPPRAPRDNWEEEFKRLAMRLLDQQRIPRNNQQGDFAHAPFLHAKSVANGRVGHCRRQR